MDETDSSRRSWRGPSSAAAALATALLSVACSGATPLTSSAAPDVASSSQIGSPSGILEVAADPIDVAVVLDTDRRVEALIPVEGGSVSATGADGTVYTLEVPSDALLNETVIGLTPVTSIAGMPFGDQSYAVQFSPEGLFLYNFAVLTIEPTEALSVDEQIPFGYLEDGADLILAAPVAESSEIKIHVQHFSGNGVTKGLLADIEPVRERLGGSAERRLSNAVAERLSQARQGSGELPDLGDLFQQYVDEVVKPRVAAAGESCAAGRLALQTVLSLERQRQLMGVAEGGGGFLGEYPGLMDTAASVCIEEEFELCTEEHVIHRMQPVWLGFERQYALLGNGDAAVLERARDLTVKCLTFRLEFESTGSLSEPSSLSFESTVTSEIELTFNPDDLTIGGEAPLVNESVEFTLASPCSVTSSARGGSTFKVFKLTILDEPDDAYGHVRDFVLSYFPGITSESYESECPSGYGPVVALPTLQMPAWFTAFGTHADEMDASGFTAVEWEIIGDDLFAEKEWTKESGSLAESGTFELHHTPSP